MGSNQSVLLAQDEVRLLSEETGFTSRQLQRLFDRFQELQRQNSSKGFLTREDLLNVNEVEINPLGQRLVDVLLEDYGSTNKLYFRQFTNVFARFRRGKSLMNLNSKKNKLLFLFSIYDRNHDSKIDRNELMEILKIMVGGNILDEQISTIADHTIGELDSDGDLTITFDEFCQTLSKIDIDEKMSMKFWKS